MIKWWQLNENNLWNFWGFFLKEEKSILSIEKFTIIAGTLTISTSWKSSKFRLQQWRADVLGHEGQFCKVNLHHIAFHTRFLSGIFYLFEIHIENAAFAGMFLLLRNSSRLVRSFLYWGTVSNLFKVSNRNVLIQYCSISSTLYFVNWNTETFYEIA